MLRRRKHRTTDQRSYRSALAKRPSVQLPARNERRFAVIGSFDESARLDGSCSARLLDRTDVAVPERNDDHEPGESMSVAFVFPGQGSQSVGMGKGLADAFGCARGVFEEVDAALGDKLSAVMWEGPAENVMRTENAQPALVAVSLAGMRVLQTEAGVDLKRDASFVAGHSVGEYSALAAAGSLTLADAVRLVRLRGRAMQEAVPVGVGAMAALLGVEFEEAAAIAAEAAQGQVVQPANDNGAGQVVLSGHKAAVERAIEIARAKGVRRTAILPVSAPFHSALMKPAAAVMADALARVTVRPPAVPLVTNVLARATSDPGEIVQGLVEQVTGTVRWRESVGFMAQAGVSSFYEVGSGKVLSALIQRIAKGARSFAIGAPDDIAAFKSKSMSH
jgi:[acyl-carrier-protein] S-malonyltransferase